MPWYTKNNKMGHTAFFALQAHNNTSSRYISPIKSSQIPNSKLDFRIRPQPRLRLKSSLDPAKAEITKPQAINLRDYIPTYRIDSLIKKKGSQE